MRALKENDFDKYDYDEFYQHHYFQIMPDKVALNAHEYFSRFGFVKDVAEEVGAERVLDLGCLEGMALLSLAKHVPTFKFGVGVDLSEDGIEVAKKRAVVEKLPVVFYQASLEYYLEGAIAKGEKFDFILSTEVMEHVNDPVLVFQLIDKVLAPGGTVVVSTPDFESPTYGKDDEKNKCHVRLYTTADEDYEAVNKYGHTRTATSLSKQIGPERIVSMDVFDDLIHCRYK